MFQEICEQHGSSSTTREYKVATELLIILQQMVSSFVRHGGVFYSNAGHNVGSKSPMQRDGVVAYRYVACHLHHSFV